MKRGFSKVLVVLAAGWIIPLVKLSQKDVKCTCENGKQDLSSLYAIHQRNKLLTSILDEMKYISAKLRQNDETIMQQWTDIVAPIRQFIAESAEHHLEENLHEHSIEYRIRSAHKQIEDMWYYIQSWKGRLENTFIEDLQSRKNAVLIELELLQQSQNDTVHKKLDNARRVVEKKIRQLQEPRDCTNAKKLLCGLGSKCGFGCQLHYAAVCFTLAVGMGRTLILDSSEWTYSKRKWEDVFMPISGASCKVNMDDAVIWRSEMTETDVHSFNVIKVEHLEWKSTPPYLPLRIPEYLYPELTRYHGDPSAWWMGQLVSYLIRPQPWLSIKISEAEGKIGFQSPVAGIHIRRTDKISEAAYHDLPAYMVHIADWFKKESMKRQRLEMPPLQRKRVYIASDDLTVLDDARRRYPDYEFLGDKRIAIMDNTGGRYSLKGIIGVTTDVTILSKCDFFVGTLSSGFSRLVYELMQVHHTDPTSNVRSLDDRYYYIQQFDRQQRAIYDHNSRAPSEISLKVGDIVKTRGDHWDGYSLGTNTRTNKMGLYPSYKTKDIFAAANFQFEKPLNIIKQ